MLQYSRYTCANTLVQPLVIYSNSQSKFFLLSSKVDTHPARITRVFLIGAPSFVNPLSRIVTLCYTNVIAQDVV